MESLIFNNNKPLYSPDISAIGIRADMEYIKNQTYDTVSPAVAMAEITSMVVDMLEKNLAYTKTNGLTEQAKNSRKNLLRILELEQHFQITVNCSQSLKTSNNLLMAENQRLRAELREIERQEKMASTLN
jgi:hypothetical protein